MNAAIKYRITKKALIAAFAAIFVVLAFARAQEYDGYGRGIRVLPSKDTIVYLREMGDWYFGPMAGPNFNLYLGELMLKRNPGRRQDTLLSFPEGSGLGYFVGVFGEYMPPDRKWGFGMRLSYDFREGENQTDPIRDSLDYIFESRTTFNNLTISPYARYNFPVKGLHAYACVDIEIIMNTVTKHRTNFTYTGDITEYRPIDITSNGIRAALNLGVGYQAPHIDVNDRMKIYLEPMLSIHGGTNLFSSDKSNWNNFLTRVGLAIRFSPDKFTILDTLKYDKDYTPPPQYIASAKFMRPLSTEISQRTQVFEGKEIAYKKYEDVIITVVSDEARTEEIEEVAEVEEPVVTIEPPPEPEIDIPVTKVDIQQRKTFGYNSAQLVPSKSMKEYLDGLAQYLKANPSVKVNIIGHANIMGSSADQQRRSYQRAINVFNYMRSKAIPEDRLFPKGLGARFPVGEARSKESIEKSPRVELILE